MQTKNIMHTNRDDDRQHQAYFLLAFLFLVIMVIHILNNLRKQANPPTKDKVESVLILPWL